MHPGTERILTTHAGGLPRPTTLLPLVSAQEPGEALPQCVRRLHSEGQHP